MAGHSSMQGDLTACRQTWRWRSSWESYILIHRQQEMNCDTEHHLGIGDLKACLHNDTLLPARSCLLQQGPMLTRPYLLIVPLPLGTISFQTTTHHDFSSNFTLCTFSLLVQNHRISYGDLRRIIDKPIKGKARWGYAWQQWHVSIGNLFSFSRELDTLVRSKEESQQTNKARKGNFQKNM